MTFAAIFMLGQATLTPAGVIDGMTEQYGYGVIGTSTAEMKPLKIPDLTNAVDVDVRLKNRWRVVRDKAMPGVFRPEVAPYYEVFDESGPGMPTVMLSATVDMDGHPVTVSSPITLAGTPEPTLPEVRREELFKPGGVRVSVVQLAPLLGVKPAFVPSVYWDRTATVRLDPRRLPPPLALLTAISGGLLSKSRKSLVFNAPMFRSLAAATLRQESERGVRTDPDRSVQIKESDLSTFASVTATDARGMPPTSTEVPMGVPPEDPAVATASLFERQRPFLLLLGAEAHLQMSDEDLKWLYDGLHRTRYIVMPDLGRRFQMVEREWRVMKTGPTRELFAAIQIGAPSGLGKAVLITTNDLATGPPVQMGG